MKLQDPVELLIVEDNPNDRELTLCARFKSITSPGHVHTAQDGAEALEFIFSTGAYAARPGRKHLRAILLDLKLPKVSGFEVLRKIKSDPTVRHDSRSSF